MISETYVKPPSRHRNQVRFHIFRIRQVVDQDIKIKVFVSEIDLFIKDIITPKIHAFRIFVDQLIAEELQKLHIDLRNELMSQILQSVSGKFLIFILIIKISVAQSVIKKRK